MCNIYDSFKITINKTDQCALLKDHSVVFILQVFHKEHKIFFRVQRFLNPKSLFEVPCTSERLGIFVISNTTTVTMTVITVAMTEIKRKCLKIKYIQEAESYAIIPLLYTNN